MMFGWIETVLFSLLFGSAPCPLIWSQWWNWATSLSDQSPIQPSADQQTGPDTTDQSAWAARSSGLKRRTASQWADSLLTRAPITTIDQAIDHVLKDIPPFLPPQPPLSLLLFIISFLCCYFTPLHFFLFLPSFFLLLFLLHFFTFWKSVPTEDHQLSLAAFF